MPRAAHPSARVTGFPPLARPDARVLVLGTMPSEASLARRQYYGNPRNRFWDIMGVLVGAGPELAYAVRLRRLTARGIALWDVARQCRRRRSADRSIRDVAANDFAAFFTAHPRLVAIAFNGGTAAALFRRLVAGERDAAGAGALHRVTLPSTSPAFAGMTWPEKLRRWRVLSRWL